MTRLTVALSGDCMATRGALITSDPAAGRLRDLLHSADFAVTNLEAVPDGGRGHPVHNAAGGSCLIADSGVLDEITSAGFTVLGCANNHALDLGAEGVLGTVQLVVGQPPNQPHRADLSKMLVHRRARRRGVGAALMQAAEDAARAAGKALLF